MKKLATLVAATSLALIAAVSTATPSSADPAGAAIAGGVLGFMAGAAAASGGGVYYDYPHPHCPRSGAAFWQRAPEPLRPYWPRFASDGDRTTTRDI